MELTVQRASKTGAASVSTVAAADLLLEFLNDGYTFLVIENGGASPITVTLKGVATGPTGESLDKEVTIAAGVDLWLWGPWEPPYYNDTKQKATCELSDNTSVTVAAVSAVRQG